MLHIKTVDGAAVPSAGPSCLECSKLILEAGVAEMWLFLETGWTRYSAREFHTATLGRLFPEEESASRYNAFGTVPY